MQGRNVPAKNKSPLLVAGEVILMPVALIGAIGLAALEIAVLLPLSVAATLLICPFSSGGFCTS